MKESIDMNEYLFILLTEEEKKLFARYVTSVKHMTCNERIS